MATYAIGDLQGCYEPLLRLLEKLRFDPAEDTLWFAGDLVNRGKHSLETLRFMRSLGKAAICVLGNHDISLIAAFHDLRKPHKSLKALVEAPDYAELIEWVAQRPILHTDQQLGYAISHAGIPPQWDMHTAETCAREVEQMLASPARAVWLAQVYGDLPDVWNSHLPLFERHRYILNAFTRMRYCRPDGSLEFEAKQHPDTYAGKNDKNRKLIPWFNYPTKHALGMTILFGHWSTLGYYAGNKVIALDTGCVWGGQLSAIRIDTNNPTLITVECTEYG
ncbi:MAG TPA: symmetrical bis(5'-nucleosyl)-tetraphosphatase [Candidatus Thiothrix moscowensis]|uniref:symmetrical bis(5'-nucleosyl)-tetraphosphatase n=1 Tax=unclassified Thiothrix TaxID=2636184 RepID=UPI0026014173|nr:MULTISPECIES: symmetrical bis(5'-nucleosyl)-tetraphosphatase [unclassified Thiothrix]HRJ54029.1 symmetrical bis(5'-nucleosyl)-tetraphosphatase [Candidatus Thiothrix moscowensis]HRJ94111.1 symmetrical bis(5'-nucleosyl)-tetraphosphatase [Candidatus Thiothrix moscowensis]